MARTASPKAGPLAELDSAVKTAGAITLSAEFRLADGRRLTAVGEFRGTGSSVQCELPPPGRASADREPYEYTFHKGPPSAVLAAVARQFPGVEFPPAAFRVSATGSPLSATKARQVVRAAVDQAYGRWAPPAADPPPEPDPTDWPAVLATGPDGVKKWNRLTTAERQAVRLGRVDLAGCHLAEINLRGATALGFKAAGANLTGAKLADGTFIGGDFRATDLTGADLKSFCGRDADFTGAKLVGVVLKDGRLLRAKFPNADLTRADLSEADVCGADFTGATLADAVFSDARFDNGTAWPAGFVPPGDMKWKGTGTDPRLSKQGRRVVATDINGLMARLHKTIDPKRMKRTLDMLKSGTNQLFAEVEPALVRGIVRSQREEDLVYSCVLTDDGTYACCTPDLSECLGLRGEPCKHLLVLVIGLTRAGQLDPTTADKWVVAAAGKNHRWNKTTKNHVSDTLLKYKGAQAGEIDWRPTETIPEDYYAM